MRRPCPRPSSSPSSVTRARGGHSPRSRPTSYFRASLARIVACAGIVAGCVALTRRPDRAGWWIALGGFTVLLGTASAWTSHAAGSPRAPAPSCWSWTRSISSRAGVWVGGLLHLIVSGASRGAGASAALLKRFSTMASVAVATLVLAGIGLTLAYVDGPRALLGTSYGVSGAGESRGSRWSCSSWARRTSWPSAGSRSVSEGPGARLPTVRRGRARARPDGAVRRRLADVAAAARATSWPSARRSLRWPCGSRPGCRALTSPRIAEMPVDDRNAPRTAADRAWSEFNHHVAGLFVLAMGVPVRPERHRPRALGAALAARVPRPGRLSDDPHRPWRVAARAARILGEPAVSRGAPAPPVRPADRRVWLLRMVGRARVGCAPRALRSSFRSSAPSAAASSSRTRTPGSI